MQSKLKKNLIENRGFSPLHWASRNGHSKVCKILIENQVNKNSKTFYFDGVWTPLHLAAWNGQLEACKVLLENQVETRRKVGFNKTTALHLAARKGHLDVCKTLIQYGLEKNGKNLIFFGKTPLEFAAENCHLGVVCYLRDQLSL